MAWNGSDQREGRTGGDGLGTNSVVRPSSFFLRLLLILAGLALVAGVAVYFFAGDGEKTARVSESRQPKIEAGGGNVERRAKVESSGGGKRSTGEGRKPKTVAEAEENLGEFEVEEVKKAEKPVDLSQYKKRVFSNGAEQLMGMIFSTELGGYPFPIPHMDEEIRKDFAAALINKLEVNDDDDDETAAVKECVEAAKKEMRRYLKEGGDPDDFMQYYYNELRMAYDHREEALSQANQLAEEDPALAREFVTKVNETFKGKGIKELDPTIYKDEDADSE